jgi:hypothetical protein
MENERQDNSLSPKLLEKLVLAQLFRFVKVFIPSFTFDALLSQN